ncbi:hypothetical protein [Telluribacter humicola]|uniref:hypothetical protein n=1 Tax=Telluribacter humicola TaxID=1720261 RepID=UPI001A97C7C0|nr:hypothetical protein [Telluribacter humicola]
MRQLVLLVLCLPYIVYGQKPGRNSEPDIVSGANVILITSTLPDAEIIQRVRQVLLSNGMYIDSAGNGTDTIKTVSFRLNTNYDMKISTSFKVGVVRISGEAYDRFGTSYIASMASERRGVSEAFARMNYYALVLRDKLGSRQIEYRKK